jgi:sugar/nucleoside kinase (ribokinase family)
MERLQYTTVGHVTVDELADGSRRPGGSAFYSALQAARLGWRAQVVTRGARAELLRLLAPYSGELELHILAARATTTLKTCGSGATRRQRLLAWAGPIAEGLAFDTSILHLAPVARETPRRWRGEAQLVGLTPQGLLRRWTDRDRQMTLCARAPASSFPARWDALVLSEQERGPASAAVQRTTAAGGVAAITAGALTTTVLTADGRERRVHAPAVSEPVDDLGAGDVFAAAFFVALAEGRDAHRAAIFANAAAAVRIAGAGAQAIGDRAAIEARLQA